MLKQLVYELRRGFAYRTISHPQMRIYTVWLPLVMTTLIIGFYALLPIKPLLVGSEGLTASLLTFVATLPGFYFAGLAAVATFGDKTMDCEMPDPAPELRMMVLGQQVTVKLTRRQFLSYLFSYLVILSFILSFALMAINTLLPSIHFLEAGLNHYTYGGWVWFFVKVIVGSCLTFSFASMIVSTLHGIFFLTEKIHQP